MSSNQKTSNHLINGLIRTLIILIIMVIFNFSLWQSNNYLVKKAVINNSTQTTNFLSNLINTELQKIYGSNSNLNKISDYTLKVDESSLNLVQIDKLSNLIEDQESNVYYFIYYFDDVIYYNELMEYTSQISQTGHSYYMVDNDGVIINAVDSDKFNKNGLYLKDFYKLNNNYEVINNFEYTVNDDYYISITNFEELGFNLYQIMEKEVFQITDVLKIIAVSATGIFLLLVIIVFIYTYIKQSKKLELDDEKNLDNFIVSKYQHFYKAIIDEQGSFISFNDLFKEQFVLNEETKVSEFNILIKDGLKEDEFVILNNDEEFVFSYFKYDNKYILVGEKKTVIANEREVYDNIHNISLLPNIRSFEAYIKTLSKTDKKTFISINMENYTSLIIEHGEHQLNLAVIEAAKQLKNTIVNIDTKLFHTSNSSFMVSYDTELGKELTQEWYLDLIKEVVEKTYKKTGVILRFKIGILDTNEELLETPLTFYFKIRELQSKTKRIYPNTVLYYDEKIQAEVFKSNELVKDIELGIINDEFEMYLQPNVNLSNNLIYSYEALLRWNNDKYHNLSPLVYIKKAEESDLIYLLGKYIIDKVLKIIQEFNNEELLVSVNISLKQFYDVNFINDLLESMKRYNVKSSQIALELTETVFASSLGKTKKSIKALRSKGFKIYLDDFGTGYSSLQYLKDLEVDTLKIDRSFVNSCVDDSRVLAITKSIVDMAHELKMDVVAEGVETIEQYQLMKEINVDLIQGYFISRPVKVDEALLMFKKEYLLKDK